MKSLRVPPMVHLGVLFGTIDTPLRWARHRVPSGILQDWTKDPRGPYLPEKRKTI